MMMEQLQIIERRNKKSSQVSKSETKNTIQNRFNNYHIKHESLPPKIDERSSTILVDDDAFFMLEDAPVDFLDMSD